MATQLMEVKPRELRFYFEVKKQSSSAIHLANVSDQFVAFKVKTTSPKKYCVQPNIGIVKPYSTCDFTVIMQAQLSVPSGMQCKDKFLIQSTVIPFGTSEEDLSASMFAKDSGKYIEEIKLRVVLVSPPLSPVLLPVNAVPKHEPFHDSPIQKEKLPKGAENLPPPHMLGKDIEDVRISTEPELACPIEAPGNVDLSPIKFQEFSHSENVESRAVKDVEGTKLKLRMDFEELQFKLNVLDLKLTEAERTIVILKQEKNTFIQENIKLKQELEVLKCQSDVRRFKAGFPPLFVCMIALISLAIGHLLRS